METNGKERISLFIKSIGITRRSFERKVGVSNGYVNNMKNSPSIKFAQNIVDTFPELNINWLLTGYGTMYSNSNKEAEEGDENLHSTKLVPLRSIGGALSGLCENGVTLDVCENIVSPIAGVDCAITVYGDSMMPDYPSGSIVLLKKVDPDLFLEWGEVYVLDTPNGIIIKELRKGEKEDYVECHSHNGEKYAPFEVPMRAVYGF